MPPIPPPAGARVAQHFNVAWKSAAGSTIKNRLADAPPLSAAPFGGTRFQGGIVDTPSPPSTPAVPTLPASMDLSKHTLFSGKPNGSTLVASTSVASTSDVLKVAKVSEQDVPMTSDFSAPAPTLPPAQEVHVPTPGVLPIPLAPANSVAIASASMDPAPFAPPAANTIISAPLVPMTFINPLPAPLAQSALSPAPFRPATFADSAPFLAANPLPGARYTSSVFAELMPTFAAYNMMNPTPAFMPGPFTDGMNYWASERLDGYGGRPRDPDMQQFVRAPAPKPRRREYPEWRKPEYLRLLAEREQQQLAASKRQDAIMEKIRSQKPLTDACAWKMMHPVRPVPTAADRRAKYLDNLMAAWLELILILVGLALTIWAGWRLWAWFHPRVEVWSGRLVLDEVCETPVVELVRGLGEVTTTVCKKISIRRRAGWF